MTPSQRRALTILTRLADRLEPALRDTYVSALGRLQQSGSLAAVERALRAGNIEAAIAGLIAPSDSAAFAHALTVGVARIVADVGPRAAGEISSVIALRFHFVPGSPAAAAAMQRMDLAAILPVQADAIAGLRDVLTQGLQAGRNPRVVARDARAFVGLTPYDYSLIASFEQQLRTDPAAALTRELRDKRFDASIVKAIHGTPLTEAQIAAQRDRYQSALHDWRAETWSRTTTLKAVRETQFAAWQQAAADLNIDPARLVKTWITTLDGRERPTHHALHGNTVRLTETFANGDMVPGDGTGVEGTEHNCRCTMTVRLLPKDPARAAAFLADRAQQFATARATKGAVPKTATPRSKSSGPPTSAAPVPPPQPAAPAPLPAIAIPPAPPPTLTPGLRADLDPAIRDVLKAREDAIRSLPHEHFTAYDGTTGAVLLNKTSHAKDYVEFTEAEVQRFTNAILTHNHPRSSSFSTADIRLAARHDAKEIRATRTDGGVYSALRPPGGWPSVATITATEKPHEDAVIAGYQVRLMAATSFQEIKAIEAEADRRFWHEVWERTFNALGIPYHAEWPNGEP